MHETEWTLPLLELEEDKSCHFKNRIKKNYRHIRKWAKRTETNCFRIYDRDIKEYPVAIDYYAGRFCIHYYFSMRDETGPPEKLEDKVTTTLTTLFGEPSHPFVWKHRAKRTRTEQYNKLSDSEDYFPVYEYGLKFWVNLEDYLDTGLFLDHRETRQIVAKAGKGKHLLNLFSYTSAFSVHAAAQGATFTKSVDMSNTYVHWSEENFRLNRISVKNHPIIRDDCLKFLYEEDHTYDVIVIDPPTLSRSKKMDQFFDIQVDHIPLIKEARRLLNPGGIIFFSTNSRKFIFEAEAFPNFTIIDITHKTIPIDFHQAKIHRCWKLTSV
jgi:23S rRNA (cytosine1962-C5)-methyltransferase